MVTRPAPRVEGVAIEWLTAFVDRDGATFDEAVRFWLAATESTLSTPRGDHAEFATLVPFDGDAYLRVQRVDVGGGSHMDLHVDNVEAYSSGATVVEEFQHWTAMADPSGFPYCLTSRDRRRDRCRSLESTAQLVAQLNRRT